MFPNFLSHSLFPRFRGFTQLRGSLWPGRIISSHLPTLLELYVEGMRGEIFAASHCIAIPMQACTQSTHSDVWSQLATPWECLFKLGDRQSEKKWRNHIWRAICNTTRGIDTRRGVIRHRGVSDGSDGASPLWWSYSARTEISFADECRFSEDWPLLYVLTLLLGVKLDLASYG
jgi:hypothetical protein